LALAILVSSPNLNIIAAVNGVVVYAFSGILFNFFYYNYSSNYIIKPEGALAAPGLKRPKPTKKNSKKHPENPPKMHASQGRHTSTDGGSHSRATARSTPNNGPL
jgi:hypothetical protein